MVSPLESVRPPLTRRSDFFEFWSRTLNALDDTPRAVTLGTVVRAPDALTIAPVGFRSLGGAGLRGFYLSRRRPGEDESADRRPLIITTHGYASQSDPVVEARHTIPGADLFCFDVRGFGQSRSACPVEPDGWILTGLTDPEVSILRGAVCDYIRAAEVAAGLRGGSASQLAFHGRSFGGALAMMAQALTGRADYLAVSVPTLGWAEGRRRLVTRGSGQAVNDYLTRHPSDEEAVMRSLSYFDTMNFADRLRGRTLVGVGLRDEIVPAETVHAIINHMSPRPEVMTLPVSHTDELEEARWAEFDERWVGDVVRLGFE